MLFPVKLSSLNCHPQHLKLTDCRAIDGDTIQANVHLPLGLKVKRRIRLKHFFAPEEHGPNPEAAIAARDALQQALELHEVHIACHGMKEDRYGRLLACLLLNGREVHGGLVLGKLQLTIEQHKSELNHAKGVIAGGASLLS